MTIRLGSPALVALAACVPASSPALDNTFGAYARSVQTMPDHIGHLPKTLEMPPVMDDSFNLTAFTNTPPMWARAITFDGLSNGEVCFQEWQSGAELGRDADTLAADYFAGVEHRVEVLAELPTKRPLWPSNGAQLVYKNVAEDKTDTKTGVPIRDVYWRSCAPMADVPANARYLAVVVHHAKPIGHEYVDDELLLWELR